MSDKSLIQQKDSIFKRFKNWLLGLFGKKSTETTVYNDIEFTSDNEQVNTPDIDTEEDERLSYEFNNSVSKTKIESIKRALDSLKIGYDELYQLSFEELKELSELYEKQIEDTSYKLGEARMSLDGHTRELLRLQQENMGQ